MSWKTKKVAELCTLIADCPHSTPKWTANGVRVLRSKNIRGGRLDLDAQVSFTSENEFESRTRRAIPQGGDLIITREAPMGEICMLPELKCCLGQRMVLMRPDASIVDPRFLLYAFQSHKVQGQIKRSEGTGTTVSNLRIPHLEALEIPFPNLEAQGQIARTLAAYDDLIENNRRRIQLLEQAARLLYKEWFVHLRFPGHEHVKITDGVPEGWDDGVVSDFYQTASGGTPSRKKPEYFTGENPWVKTKELPNGFVLDTEEHITDDAISNSAAKLFSTNTVLLALYGATIGELGILSTNATCNQACCAIMSKDERSHYTHAYLFFRENQRNLVSLSGGAAQNNISQQIVRGFPMTMPTTTVITLFVEAVTPTFKQWLNLERQNLALKTARDILLPRLMNGEIPV